MSKKPYIIQPGNPNLVIVPTECYEPSPKKQKLDNVNLFNVPIQNQISESWFNNAIKVNSGAQCRNSNVLIDVSQVKKQQPSWAATFLQSIGEQSSKLSRSYQKVATKSTPPPKETTQPCPSKEPNQLKTNLKTIPLKACQPNTLKKAYDMNTSKLVTQSKPHKITTQPEAIKEVTQPKANKETSQLKLDKEVNRKQANKEDTKSKKGISHTKVYKDTNPPKIHKEVCQPSTFKVATQRKCVNKEKCNKEPNVCKLASQPTTKIEANQQKTNKAYQSNTYKKANQPNTDKTASQPNTHKKADQPSAQKVPIKSKPNQEATKPNPYEESTISTNPKIKKETIQISNVKPPTPLLKKDEIKLNLKKLRVTEEKSIELKKVKTKNATKSKITKVTNDLSKSLHREPSKSISPIKSVVTKIDNSHLNSSDKRYYKKSDLPKSEKRDLIHRESDADLRTKLKRKISKNAINRKERHRESKYITDKFPKEFNEKGFVPDENLIISFNAESDNEEVGNKKTPIKIKTQKQSRGNKLKKIKLEINIIYQNTDTTDDESLTHEDEDNKDIHENSDLSFLDDFNIDEIVESLNDCQNDKEKTNTKTNSNINIYNHSTVETDLKTIDGKKTDDFITKAQIFIKSVSGNSEHKRLSLLETQVEEQKSSLEFIIQKQSLTSQNAAFKTDALHLDTVNISTVLQKEKENHNVHCLDEIATKETNDDKKNIGETTIDLNSRVLVETLMNQSKNYANSNQLGNDSNMLFSVKSHIVNTCTGDNIIISEDNSLNKSQKEDISMISLTQFSNENSVHKNSVKLSSSLRNKSTDHSKVENDKQKKNAIRQQCVSPSNYVKNQDDTYNNQMSNSNKTPNAVVDSLTIKTDEFSNNIKTIEEKSDVISIEDSDNDPQTILDLMYCKDYSLDKKSDEVVLVDGLKPNTVEIEPEQILIIDTDYDVDVESTFDLKEIQNATNETITNVIINTSNENKLKNGKINYITADGQNPNSIKAKVKDECDNNFILEDKNNSAVTKLATDKQDPEKTNIQEITNDKRKTVIDKSQNLNSKTPPKMQDNVNSQVKSDNLSNTIKNNELKLKPEKKSLLNDKFAQSLEARMHTHLGEKCDVIKLIHRGRFSSLYCYEDKSGCKKTVKVLNNSRDYYGVNKENMLMKLQNGVPEDNLNCVRLFYGFSMSGRWCFVMEYFPKNLEQVLNINKRSFHIDDVQMLSRQLVAAVTILRNNNIIHSDIKPHHILINDTETRLKLCGFDRSLYYENNKLLPSVGTVNYRAPELILGFHTDYSIDVWSAALVMYEMATHQKLFHGYFNNNILYQQLCLLGNIPLGMLQQCAYKHIHYKGVGFSRIIGKGQTKMIYHFEKRENIYNVILRVYTHEWEKHRMGVKRAADKWKIFTFSKLLRQMLVLNPKNRIPIEFVFANPFIYEKFGDC